MDKKANHIYFQEEISKRGAEFPIHFTPITSLYSILERGKLMLRKTLKNLDIKQFDILDYIQFIGNVKCGDKGSTSLSISGPNTFLSSKFQERTKDDMTINWYILRTDPKYIYEKEVEFSVTNATSDVAKVTGVAGDLDKFEMLSANSINISCGICGRINSKYPTNVQAEVLVKGDISVESIIEVCPNSIESFTSVKAALSEFDTNNFVVDMEIFSSNRTL